MMWWNHGAWGAGDWWAMSFMMLVFWGLVIVLAIWLVHSSWADRGGEGGSLSSPQQRADEVLAERFARGEINAEEFTRRHEMSSNDSQ